MNLKLTSEYTPKGDQPTAIRDLTTGIEEGQKYQTLLGVTGSGKTFTIANVIQEIQRPTLVLAHNKTLAAQLYGEFKAFFPNNAVEYFVSYYDYYQPEAYIPVTNTYIEKDLSINEDIERMRLSTSSSLMSGRRDVIVVASVSCIFGMGNPMEFKSNLFEFKIGEQIMRQKFLYNLVKILYSRTEDTLKQGTFRVRGDVVDIFPGYTLHYIRVSFWDDEIESIEAIDPQDGQVISVYDSFKLFPATLFVTSQEKLEGSIIHIQKDLKAQLAYLKNEGKNLEASRLKERVEFDIAMMRELGYCSGIENYSRYLDRRQPGERPFCLLDYFPDDFVLVIDESHVTIPQVRAMYNGDRSRKEVLVEHGFRLPAALDNRPLKFEEFESLLNQTIYVSATPADYELEKCGGVYIEQVVRPTGLLDPPIEIKPCESQVDDVIEEINTVIENDERILVTTLTKKMAEELSAYLTKVGVRAAYIHSDVDTLDRIEIMQKLRQGYFDVLIGVNLLREGLDLPEVSLVAILDADKEGFLRSHRSLTQTSGRAARNVRGRVIMYADKITQSMQRTIDETQRRREKQTAYNTAHNITPTEIKKSIERLDTLISKPVEDPINTSISADTSLETLLKDTSVTPSNIDTVIKKLKKQMEEYAKQLDFINAAKYRDKIKEIERQYKQS